MWQMRDHSGWVFFHKYHIRHFQWCLVFETEVLFRYWIFLNSFFNNTFLLIWTGLLVRTVLVTFPLDDTISNTVLTIWLVILSETTMLLVKKWVSFSLSNSFLFLLKFFWPLLLHIYLICSKRPDKMSWCSVT